MDQIVDTTTLIQRIALGDEAALETFYDQTVSRAYAVIVRITVCPERAEEVVNDAYLQVWRQAVRYDASKANPVTWLMMICRSRAIDHMRRNAASCHNQSEFNELGHASNEPAPELIVESVKTGSTLRQALLALNPDQRNMLELAFFRGMSHQEIADFTGKALGTVKTLIRRGQIALREEINRMGSQDKKVTYGQRA
ncbi:MAG: RNA polymerase sigma factor [Thiotrichales bacterium]